MLQISEPYNQPTEVIEHKNFLSLEEISKLSTDLKNIPYEPATTHGLQKLEVRKSKIKWLGFNKEFQWLYYKVIDQIQLYNSYYWNFKLEELKEPFQYTEYNSTYQGKYDWHLDLGKDKTSFRKISLTIQLSSPKEYEGGILQVYDRGLGKGEYKDAEFPVFDISKGLGNAVFFPSFFPHRVTPVTKGIRRSLVLWVGGCPFR